MQSRFILNLGLLAFLIALSGFIFLSSENNENTKQKITSLNKTDINKITIPRKTENIILTRKGNKWFMKSPHATRAHSFRINSLLNLVEIESDNIYSTKNLDLKTFGLDKPRASIIFNNTLIEFGKSNPVNHRRYLKSGENLFLIDDTLYPLISSQPTSFVDLALLSETDNIQKITLPELTVFKDSNNIWKTKPENIASADDIQNLLQNWKFAKAFAVHAYMPRKNLGQIDITVENNKVISFKITDNEPWLILARPELDIEYHLDISNKDKLLSIQPH